MNSKYFEEEFCSCDCGSEVMRVAYDKDEDWGMEFAIFDLRYHNGIRQRLRLAWKCLKHGSPYNDQIILGKDHVKGLIYFLKKYLGEGIDEKYFYKGD